MLIDTSYEKLLEEYLSLAPEGIDIRQGSIYYDAGAGFLFILSRFYSDLNHVYDKISLQTAVGKYLDDKANDFGLQRHKASNALYEYSFEAEEEGDFPQIGDRFFIDGHFFVIDVYMSETVLKAEQTGSGENNILYGSAAVPVESAKGLKSLLFGQLLEAARDEETDDELRQRLRERLAGPAENGNRQHYKTWCEQVEGVGLARILPINPDINHVKAVILSKDGALPSEEVLAAVQKEIDPNNNGDGSGKANMGAVFTAVMPNEVFIDVAVKIISKNDTISHQELQDAIKNYISKSNLAAETEGYIISLSKLGYEIIGLGSVKDYEDLSIEINGQSFSSVFIESDSIAVLRNLEIIE